MLENNNRAERKGNCRTCANTCTPAQEISCHIVKEEPKQVGHDEMNTLPKIAAVDFDGTLVKDKFPAIGEIRPKTWAEIMFLKEHGWKLILWTCRADDKNGTQLTDAVEFCKAHGLEFDAVNRNIDEVISMFGGDTRKVYANIYIDDKAVIPVMG